MGPNERILRDACARCTKGDFAGVVSLFASDIRWKSPGSPNRLETAGVRQGIEGAAAYIAASAVSWTPLSYEVQEIFVSGDTRFAVRVVVEVQSNITRKIVRVEKVDFVTMKDGKVTDFAEVLDTAPLERASRL
jgi:ketosteroid isomerase-like protein